jgi:large subunit ribosomal protein L35
MERIHQMSVIPDLLPTFSPTVDLRVSFVEAEEVVPGAFLPVNVTLQAPSITAQAFHPDEKLYTLLIVDPGTSVHCRSRTIHKVSL